MANSFISSLATLDPTSVTNTSSLFFYLSNNDTSQLYSGRLLETQIGHSFSTVAMRTAVETVPANTAVLVEWDNIPQDPLGMWDAASASIIKPGFTGWVQFRCRGESNTGGGIFTRNAILKNGGELAGLPYFAYRDYVTGYRDMAYSAPVSCSPTDYFEYRAYYNTACQIGDSKTWIECIPLQVYV